MASEHEHAQCELTCIAWKKKCVNIPSNVVLIVLLFQENKSFGAITICIHPMMYKKPCREQFYWLKKRIDGVLLAESQFGSFFLYSRH
jgi:hypothetical protein